MNDLNDLLLDRQEPFEILIIAKGTGDFLRGKLDDLLSCNDRIKAFEFETKTPQAVCLKAAFRESAGEIIVACGPDQQITNDSFAKLLDSLDAESDIVTPWRELSIDGIINRTQSSYYTCGQLHDQRNPDWKPYKILWQLCKKYDYDPFIAREIIEDRIGQKLTCECQLLNDKNSVRRMTLQKVFGADFRGPGRRDFDIV